MDGELLFPQTLFKLTLKEFLEDLVKFRDPQVPSFNLFDYSAYIILGTEENYYGISEVVELSIFGVSSYYLTLGAWPDMIHQSVAPDTEIYIEYRKRNKPNTLPFLEKVEWFLQVQDYMKSHYPLKYSSTAPTDSWHKRNHDIITRAERLQVEEHSS